MSTRQQRREVRRINAHKAPGSAGLPPPALLKSGLAVESPEFAQLQTEYFDRFHPHNPEQRFQVDNLIRNEWFLRRFFRVEAHLWDYQVMLAGRSSGVQLGEAFSKASPIFMRLQRRVTAAEKAYKEAMAELLRLQQLPQPQETTAETQQLGSFLTTPSGQPPAFPLPLIPAVLPPVFPPIDTL